MNYCESGEVDVNKIIDLNEKQSLTELRKDFLQFHRIDQFYTKILPL